MKQRHRDPNDLSQWPYVTPWQWVAAVIGAIVLLAGAYVVYVAAVVMDP